MLSLTCYAQRTANNNPVELSENAIKNIQFAETSDLKILIHGITGSLVDKFNTMIRNGESKSDKVASSLLH